MMYLITKNGEALEKYACRSARRWSQDETAICSCYCKISSDASVYMIEFLDLMLTMVILSLVTESILVCNDFRANMENIQPYIDHHSGGGLSRTPPNEDFRDEPHRDPVHVRDLSASLCIGRARIAAASEKEKKEEEEEHGDDETEEEEDDEEEEDEPRKKKKKKKAAEEIVPHRTETTQSSLAASKEKQAETSEPKPRRKGRRKSRRPQKSST
ncbi:uncharacterized protein A4U43_C03F24170 [Asparagus officinalis]|uniref:Uncharacterized protein n=1 Tax=Asparagus officinalis TaxID=4686 RepID=A0A5P1FDD9_ASPOF|nr:uncharacterized protein A4U43_C03F24170 [Asparagus officinalis]